jgi:hypothetical protein
VKYETQKNSNIELQDKFLMIYGDIREGKTGCEDGSYEMSSTSV